MEERGGGSLLQNKIMHVYLTSLRSHNLKEQVLEVGCLNELEEE